MSIAQLFSRFDHRQTVEIARAFKEVLETNKNFDTAVVVDTPHTRCLVSLSIQPIETKRNAVQGKLCYLQLFPSE